MRIPFWQPELGDREAGLVAEVVAACRPDGSVRLAELEAVVSCGICFDLVPDPKYQGYGDERC